MRRRFIAIIAVIIVTKPQFQDFSHLFHSGQGLVHRGQACGRILLLESLVQLGSAGVALAGGEKPQQCQALGSDAISASTESGNKLLESGFRISDFHLL